MKVVDMKCKSSAEEVMPKLRDVVDHAKGFTLRCGIVLFSRRESSACVVHRLIPVRRCALHETLPMAVSYESTKTWKGCDQSGGCTTGACDNISFKYR